MTEEFPRKPLRPLMRSKNSNLQDHSITKKVVRESEDLENIDEEALEEGRKVEARFLSGHKELLDSFDKLTLEIDKQKEEQVEACKRISQKTSISSDPTIKSLSRKITRITERIESGYTADEILEAQKSDETLFPT